MTTATVTGARPRDWAPLTENGRDPIPGDWEEVKATMESLRATARMIKRCRDLLTTVEEDSESWKGESGTAFREHTTGLGDRVHKAHGRYEVAAEALDDYWPVLRDAQEESLELRKAAIEAQEEAAEYAAKAEAAEDPDSDFHDRHDEFTGTAEEARGRIASLRGRLADLIRERDAAAADAAEAIRDFIGKDDVRNRFWDGKWEAIQDILGKVGEWAGFIGAIAGIAALFLGWIPVFGQILGAVALIGTAISMLGNIVNGNWSGAALDLLGILTVGIGRAAGTMVKATGAGAKVRVFSQVRLARGIGNRAARKKKAQEILGDTHSNLKKQAAEFDHSVSVSGFLKNSISEIRKEVTDIWKNPHLKVPPDALQVLRKPKFSDPHGVINSFQAVKGNFDAVGDLTGVGKAGGYTGQGDHLLAVANYRQIGVEFGLGGGIAANTIHAFNP
ncbi:hypothetical protein FNQ90_03070 [Streptomyces alkaliphilus]|uniref:Putative T7SS secretion signal domain-containing protein n=1 Tax=Streptomyces alkaliphilus TaxID=1472722 RepID=A0A7W3Y0A8_9ACTN|nr:hypothetical protein [Streptomyces alkaliphilus]MBB0243117.1 hypothetical protein [Streptomyces alkaliphilus]